MSVEGQYQLVDIQIAFPWWRVTEPVLPIYSLTCRLTGSSAGVTIHSTGRSLVVECWVKLLSPRVFSIIFCFLLSFWLLLHKLSTETPWNSAKAWVNSNTHSQCAAVMQRRMSWKRRGGGVYVVALLAVAPLQLSKCNVWKEKLPKAWWWEMWRYAPVIPAHFVLIRKCS